MVANTTRGRHINSYHRCIPKQTWIQEAEAEYSARKASTRSFGVGEKDIWDEENRLIKEREMRTIVIGQQEKPSQRNVGLQVTNITIILVSAVSLCMQYSLVAKSISEA